MEQNLRTEVGGCQEKVVAAQDPPAGALGLEQGKVAEVCLRVCEVVAMESGMPRGGFQTEK